MASDDYYDNLFAPKTSESTESKSEGVKTFESTETAKSEEEKIQKIPNTITCPYNSEHKVPIEGFNAHIWKCRSERMFFYPNALSLRRCRFNIRHFVPEEELAFHELFCEKHYAPLYAQLETEPVHLDVNGFLEAQKLHKELEDGDDYISDEEDEDRDSTATTVINRSVTSEVETSDVEEAESDDVEVAVKRLEYLQIMKKNGIV